MRIYFERRAIAAGKSEWRWIKSIKRCNPRLLAKATSALADAGIARTFPTFRPVPAGPNLAIGLLYELDELAL